MCVCVRVFVCVCVCVQYKRVCVCSVYLDSQKKNREKIHHARHARVGSARTNIYVLHIWVSLSILASFRRSFCMWCASQFARGLWLACSGRICMHMCWNFTHIGLFIMHSSLFVSLFWICDVHPSSREDCDWHARVRSAWTNVELSYVQVSLSRIVLFSWVSFGECLVNVHPSSREDCDWHAHILNYHTYTSLYHV